MEKKAILLLSGGLDSTLAVKLMLEDGIEIYALNFTSPFCVCSGGKENKGCKSSAKIAAERFSIPIKTLVKGLEYMEIVKNPKWGYGSGMNPCVDCRIYMLKLAKKYMEEIGASFIVTGEVLGQRPMSQRRDTFKTMEKESGLEGLILRPLSAKHLPLTAPEKAGIVDRKKLLNISGRTRKPQMALASQFAISDYPCPSGGCLLTDKMFSKKVRDLLAHKKELTIKDLLILKIGRHFRKNGMKVVVSKNAEENSKLKNLVQPGEMLLEPVGFPGPSAILSGQYPDNAIETAGALMIRYSPKVAGAVEIMATLDGISTSLRIASLPDKNAIDALRIC